MGIYVTIVGLESFIKTTTALNKFEESVFNEFVEYRVDLMGEGHEYCEEVCRDEWELISFLTMEEYEEKVGEDRFLIDTVK